MERVFLSRLLEATARVVPRDNWQYLVVDGLGIQPRLAPRNLLKAELAKHRFPNGDDMFSVKTPGGQQQRETLKNTTEPPTAGCAVPELPSTPWNEHVETVGAPALDAAAALAEAGQSFALLGYG